MRWTPIPCLIALSALAAGPASARPEFPQRLPNSPGCATCHTQLGGGYACAAGTEPCLNDFGWAFAIAGRTWTPELAAADSDGDGCSNGDELGDPMGTFDPADPAWAQPVADDFCPRSPGLNDNAAEPAQCARNSTFCCAVTERPPTACECGADAPELRLCVDRPEGTPLMDRSWTDFVAGAGGVQASCPLRPGAAWFEYRPDCEGDSMLIEVEDPADVVVFADRRDFNERACVLETQAVRVANERVVIAVSGVDSSRVRVTCEPRDGPVATGTTCGDPRPIRAGVHQLVVQAGVHDGPSVIPGERCPADVERDGWFRYDARCNGTVEIGLTLGSDEGIFGGCAALGTVDATFGIYAPDTCPERAPALRCDQPEVPICALTALPVYEAPIRAGQALLIRLGRTSPLSIVPLTAELSINCRVPAEPRECVAACLLGRRGVRCLYPDDAPIECACEIGHSPVPGTDPFDCEIRCGDGVRGIGEECDDGNLAAGDGCSPLCEEEPLFRCFEADGGLSDCEGTCGDGLIHVPFEACDDGNRVNGDGCDAQCQVEDDGTGCAIGHGGPTPWWLGLWLVVGLRRRG